MFASVKKLLRNLLPTHLLESGRELIKGEGVYYSRAFDETKSMRIFSILLDLTSAWCREALEISNDLEKQNWEILIHENESRQNQIFTLILPLIIPHCPYAT